MSDIKRILSDEFRRIARKEIKSALAPIILKVSEMRKTIAAQEKLIKSLQKLQPIPVAEEKTPPASDVSGKIPRISKEGIVKLRTKLGVSQSVFAKLLDVGLSTAVRWESGKNTPRLEQKRRIAALRSMGKRELAQFFNEKGIQTTVPAKKTSTVQEDSSFSPMSLTAFRETHKLTKIQLAALLGVNHFSVGHWESGKSVPRAAQKTKISALLALSDDELQLKLDAIPEKAEKKQIKE